MRVLLVNPPTLKGTQMSPPLGLGYIGAYLVSKGYETELLDLALPGHNGLLQTIREYKPEVVGITGLSAQYNGMKHCAGIAKRGGATVLVGGIHASALPKFTLEDCKDIDIVVKGEGELSLVQLLESGSPTGIPGLFYRDNGGIRGLPPEYIEDLDSLPFPWNFLKLDDYKEVRLHGFTSKYGSVVSVLGSRGCPYSCTFCSASQALGKKIRLRSIPNFISELKELKSTGVREVQILDDNFTFYRDYAYGVCEEAIKEKLSIAWTLPNGIRADRVDYELLSKMKEAGCYYFGIGIESGSKRVLALMEKKLELSKVGEMVRWSNRLGFVTQGFLLVGYPGESEEDLRQTEKLVLGLPLDRISINPVVPYPGAKIFGGTGNWEKLDRLKYRVELTEEKRKFIRRLYLRFYLNPIRLLRHLLKMRTPSQVVGFIKGFTILIRELG